MPFAAIIETVAGDQLALIVQDLMNFSIDGPQFSKQAYRRAIEQSQPSLACVQERRLAYTRAGIQSIAAIHFSIGVSYHTYCLSLPFAVLAWQRLQASFGKLDILDEHLMRTFLLDPDNTETALAEMVEFAICELTILSIVPLETCLMIAVAAIVSCYWAWIDDFASPYLAKLFPFCTHNYRCKLVGKLIYSREEEKTRKLVADKTCRDMRLLILLLIFSICLIPWTYGISLCGTALIYRLIKIMETKAHIGISHIGTEIWRDRQKAWTGRVLVGLGMMQSLLCSFPDWTWLRMMVTVQTVVFFGLWVLPEDETGMEVAEIIIVV